MTYCRTAVLAAVALIFCASSALGMQIDQAALKTRTVTQDGFETSFAAMTGAWAMTTDTFGLSGAEHLVADGETFTGTNGSTYLVVERAFSTLGLGLTRYEPTLEAWFLLFDSSTNYYKAYVYTIHGDEVDGRYWLYPKDEDLTGPGYWLRGFLFAEPGQMIPARASKAGVSLPDFDARDEAAARATPAGHGQPAPVALGEMVQELRALQALRSAEP